MYDFLLESSFPHCLTRLLCTKFSLLLFHNFEFTLQISQKFSTETNHTLSSLVDKLNVRAVCISFPLSVYSQILFGEKVHNHLLNYLLLL